MRGCAAALAVLVLHRGDRPRRAAAGKLVEYAERPEEGTRSRIPFRMKGSPSRSSERSADQRESPPSPEDGLRRGSLRASLRSERRLEPRGFEPLTPTMPLWCSTN